MSETIEFKECYLHELTATELKLFLAMKWYGWKSLYFEFPQSVWKDEMKLYTNRNQFYKNRNSLVEKQYIEYLPGNRVPNEYRILK